MDEKMSVSSTNCEKVKTLVPSRNIVSDDDREFCSAWKTQAVVGALRFDVRE
jgi:hypothetical protein